MKYRLLDKLTELIFLNLIIYNDTVLIDSVEVSYKLYEQLYKRLKQLSFYLYLNDNELAQIYIILDKYYAIRYKTNTYNLLLANWHNDILVSMFITIAIFYDDPMTKMTWAELSKMSYNDFLMTVFDICSLLDYDFDLPNAKNTSESINAVLNLIS